MLQDNNLLNIINKLNNDTIYVDSLIIHKKKTITKIENFIYNIDQYICFLKDIFKINQLEIRYILHLTIYSNIKLFTKELYFYDDKEFYISQFKNILLNKYKKNVKLMSLYIDDLTIYNFNELVSIVNGLKRPYVLFENINKDNINYYKYLWEK